MTIASNGAITFTGGAGPNVALADIVNVTDRLACCSRIDIAIDFDINGSGAVDGSDKIDLFLNAAGELSSVEYTAGEDLADMVGVRFDSVALPEHDGTAIPATSSMAVSAVIEGGDTVALDMEVIPESYGSNVFFNISVSAELENDVSVLQQRIAIRLEGAVALASGQSFDCYDRDVSSANERTTRIDVKTAPAFTSDYSSVNGGACRITLTNVVVDEVDTGRFTLVEGTFTAELFPNKRSNPKVTIDDGVFRWVPAAP
jgi:hypothetical protein